MKHCINSKRMKTLYTPGFNKDLKSLKYSPHYDKINILDVM